MKENRDYLLPLYWLHKRNKIAKNFLSLILVLAQLLNCHNALPHYKIDSPFFAAGNATKSADCTAKHIGLWPTMVFPGGIS